MLAATMFKHAFTENPLMSWWKGILRITFAVSLVILLLLGFSLLNIDRGTEAGREAFIMSILALIPIVLTLIGVAIILANDWDPF